jgi:shikimate dehydrogenase
MVRREGPINPGNAHVRDRRLVGLIGAKIGRSVTPAMHEAAARALGIDLHYHLIDTEALGRDARDLPRLIEGVRLLGFAGVNVTHPFKEAVIACLDAVEGPAAGVGSVNTVVVRDRRLVGHNTDYTGFVSAWRQVFAAMPPGSAALLGAGGVGRAMAHALVALGAVELRITDLDRRRADALAADLRAAHPSVRIALAADADAAMRGADGAVNATPVGMHAYPGNPAPAAAFEGLRWAADAVYTPLETEFIAAARRLRASVMTGQELAIGQAVDAFALFVGRPAPVDIMRAVFLEKTQPGGTTRAAE